MTDIAQSVGNQGANQEADVRAVQGLLNVHAVALGLAPLGVDGKTSPALVEAIRRFQMRRVRLATGDGKVDAGGRTWRVLKATGAPGVAANLSGADWWHANQAKFPNSELVSALEAPFAAKVASFIAALKAGGASVTVSATRRNKVRAYLMNGSWVVSKGMTLAAKMKTEPGCSIVWDHGDESTSRAAAKEMLDLFDIVFQPSLTSRHIVGLAVDMTISWAGTIKVKDGKGKDVSLPPPAKPTNPTLLALGASYGVLKLATDPPHWSDNGH
jgi:hypothetical protein